MQPITSFPDSLGGPSAEAQSTAGSSPRLAARLETDRSGASSPETAGDSSDSEEDLEYSEEVDSFQGHVMEDGMRMRKVPDAEIRGPWISSKLHEPEEGERKYRSQHSSRTNFEELERQSAQNYVIHLVRLIPSLLASSSSCEVDQLLLDFSSKVCDSEYSLNTLITL